MSTTGAGRVLPRNAGTCRGQRAGGYTLLELLVALAVSSLLLVVGIPPLVRLSARLRVELAAAEVASTLRLARADAVRFDRNVGLKFRVKDDGSVTWALYRDGDGDGVLSADIASGEDPEVRPEQRLAHFGRGVHFGFPPGRAPRDPSDPRRRLDHLEDPIRFNRSDIAAFSPIGSATPGTVYLTDGDRLLAAVRITSASGRVRVLEYDREAEVWR